MRKVLFCYLFCLKPLSLIFAVFTPPDSGSHQLTDIQGSEVVWLNKFEYTPSLMLWRVLRDFLEGEPLKGAVPKTSGKNYIFTDSVPVFDTAPGPMERPSKSKETEHFPPPEELLGRP